MLTHRLARSCSVAQLTAELRLPMFPDLLRRFLYDQLQPDGVLTSSDVPLQACPKFTGKINIHNSAVATIFAPSDLSGTGGMRREFLHAVPSWRKKYPRYDCAFLNSDPDTAGMRGMDVVRVQMFFSFVFNDKTYPCALVHWYSKLGDAPDEDVGMWVVQPEVHSDGSPEISVIHLDCVIRAAHLLPVFGDRFISKDITFYNSLDAFKAFYVNRFIDHHAFELLSE